MFVFLAEFNNLRQLFTYLTSGTVLDTSFLSGSTSWKLVIPDSASQKATVIAGPDPESLKSKSIP
jgi:hypothetical protein